jgi:hypothetical protein
MGQASNTAKVTLGEFIGKLLVLRDKYGAETEVIMESGQGIPEGQDAPNAVGPHIVEAQMDMATGLNKDGAVVEAPGPIVLIVPADDPGFMWVPDDEGQETK